MIINSLLVVGGMAKGEVSSTQVVLIIIALAGFIVLLLFLFSLKIQESGDAQACRLSALTRASLPVSARTSAPLACTTTKYCLTSNSDACGLSMAGEKPEIVKLSDTNTAASATKIEELTAQAMYQCWQTLGQGKLNLFDTYIGTHGLQAFFGSQSLLTPSCVICSRIAVDPSVSLETKRTVNFAQYISTQTVPGKGVTYLQAFSDASVRAFPQIGARTLTQIPPVDVTFSPRSDEYAVVFMQIHAPDSFSAVKGLGTDIAVAGAIGGAGAFYIAPGTLVSKGVSLYNFAQNNFQLLTRIGTVAVPVALAGGGAAWLGAEASQAMAAGYCGEFNQDKTLQKSSGCSIIQVVPYDAKVINQMCGQIAGSP